jgi:FkbM family methyltransferase
MAIRDIAKRAVLWSIGQGLRPPQTALDRISELAFLKQLLADLAIDCVLDVGANRGQFATELRKIGYTGYIVSFEPVKREYLKLQAAFRKDARWRGYQLALGSSDEMKPIMIPPYLTEMSSLLEPAAHARVGGENYQTEMVEVRRLDGVFASRLGDLPVSRIFLKMDTQGYDLEVFKGTSGCRTLIHGIQSELSVRPVYEGMPHYLEALDTYESAGFELDNFSVVARRSDGALVEMNCFMRRGPP